MDYDNGSRSRRSAQIQGEIENVDIILRLSSYCDIYISAHFNEITRICKKNTALCFLNGKVKMNCLNKYTIK